MIKNIRIMMLGFLLVSVFGYLQGEHFLSFVMPCYNCAQTIRESLDSIYQQDLTIPFEVVCTDDGSTDKTLAILREYEAKYPNFHVVRHAKNLGGGAANNTCVAHAKGDLLFRLDSDNVLAANSVQGLVDLLDTTGCDAAAFQELRFFVRDHTGQKVPKWSSFSRIKDNIFDLCNSFPWEANPAASGNYLYTRESFNRAGGYPNGHGSDTHCFGLKQYLTGSRIAILPGTFYWHYYNESGYYCREESTGNNRRAVWAVLKQFKELFTEETKLYLDRVDVNQVDAFVAMNEGKIVPLSKNAQ